MPATEIRLFRAGNGKVPMLDWLSELEASEQRAYEKCLFLINLLIAKGRTLRMPFSRYLRDGICELRGKVGTVNYRILYFHCGNNAVCLSHGFTKEREVPDSEIEVAVARANHVASDPQKYTADFEV